MIQFFYLPYSRIFVQIRHHHISLLFTQFTIFIMKKLKNTNSSQFTNFMMKKLKNPNKAKNLTFQNFECEAFLADMTESLLNLLCYCLS